MSTLTTSELAPSNAQTQLSKRIAGWTESNDVAVGVPMHTIQRDERYYEQAAEFVSEQWTTERAEMLKDKRAYAPFSLGTDGCLGRGLELRMAIARVALNFNIGFAEGEDRRRLDEETKDTFSLTAPSVMASFTVRR